MPVVPKDINKQVVFKAEQLLNLKRRTLVQQPFLKDSRTKDALGLIHTNRDFQSARMQKKATNSSRAFLSQLRELALNLMVTRLRVSASRQVPTGTLNPSLCNLINGQRPHFQKATILINSSCSFQEVRQD